MSRFLLPVCGLLLAAPLLAQQLETHDQSEEPGAACLRFPQSRFRVAVSATDGLEVTMHAAFGKAGLFGKTSDAQLPVFTNYVANRKTFGSQSHVVDPCAEEWLKS